MHPYTTSKKRRLRLFSQLTGWLNCPGTKIIPARSSVLDFFYCVLYFFCSTFTCNWRLCIFCTLGNEYMLQQTRFPLPSQISHVLGGRAQYTRVTLRQVPTGRIRLSFALWNVPIQIFAICYTTLDVYNGFRCRKGWHSTLGKKLCYMLGFHFY